MREAWHNNDEKIYLIPQNLSEREVENYKQIAKKGTFTCPYCEAKLIVKSGDVLGNYFSHLHGEGCEISKQSEARYKKYEKQKKNDTPRHPQILSLMNDELEVLSRVYPHLTSSYGYLNNEFSKYIPDISLKIKDQKYALTIITNISSSTDTATAKNINKQKQYYETLGYEPLFFIERSHLGVDIDGQSLVLWATENEALTTQKADIGWKRFLTSLAPKNEYHQILNLPNTDLNVKSIMYITPANEEIAIEAFHVLQHPNTTPVKANFLNSPYKLTISEAFKLADDKLLLADMQIESENQSKFAEKFRQTKRTFIEQQKELERIREEQETVAKLKEKERQKQAEEKRKGYQESLNNSSYKKADKVAKLELLKRTYNANN
ncbi:competence protein CoiA family protein [Ureibacillus chungkukjangi]|uniref:Competence protein CoiA-like protein n=1 Tax=Ureibacillus chungkukjangi TaxID=1202712 RepID=A0A318TLD4_9BACL|nr:competence protein CoiA family protein [Ureibacillus chungkukjangi]PYF05652.1 competence protein CoiA-like protein [Ureibacillus chungkukjangi]